MSSNEKFGQPKKVFEAWWPLSTMNPNKSKLPSLLIKSYVMLARPPLPKINKGLFFFLHLLPSFVRYFDLLRPGTIVLKSALNFVLQIFYSACHPHFAINKLGSSTLSSGLFAFYYLHFYSKTFLAGCFYSPKDRRHANTSPLQKDPAGLA